jgi:hypothetical protein
LLKFRLLSYLVDVGLSLLHSFCGKRGCYLSFAKVASTMRLGPSLLMLVGTFEARVSLSKMALESSVQILVEVVMGLSLFCGIVVRVECVTSCFPIYFVSNNKFYNLLFYGK